MPRSSRALAMTLGGRLPAASVALNACTACSVLPASSSLPACSTARCASAGSCFFLLAEAAAWAPASAGSPAAALSSPALPAATAPVLRAQINPNTATTGTGVSKRQPRAIMTFPSPTRAPPSSNLKSKARLEANLQLPPIRLFHSHRLGEIARLIDICTHECGGMVGEELHGYSIDQGWDRGVRLGHGDVRLELAAGASRGGIGYQDDLAAARRHFLHVGDGFFEQIVFGGDDDDGHVFVDQGDRPVLELTGGIALGVNIGNLLQFERALERNRVADAAAEVEHVLGPGELVRQLLKQRLASEQGRDMPRHLRQSVDEILLLAGSDGLARPAERDGQACQRAQLAGEGLGRGNADFGARQGRQHDVCFTGNGRGAHVNDGGDRLALRLAVAQRRQGVGGFARLGDEQRQTTLAQRRLAVAKLRG